MGVVGAQYLERRGGECVLVTLAGGCLHWRRLQKLTMLPLCVPTICVELSTGNATCSSSRGA